LPKCERCINLKHRYMMLTGMHYPEIQEALEAHKIKAENFMCEGMGCQFFSKGLEVGVDMRNIAWDCPHFELRVARVSSRRLRIDSHANLNEYPEPMDLTMQNGKVVLRKKE